LYLAIFVFPTQKTTRQVGGKVGSGVARQDRQWRIRESERHFGWQNRPTNRCTYA
jgi:hypothetical protein